MSTTPPAQVTARLISSGKTTPKKSLATALCPAREADAEDISNLVRKRSEALNYGPPNEFEVWFEARYSVAQVLDRIRNPAFMNLVLTENGQLIGSAYINMSTGYLGGLHVARDGEGLGTLLIKTRLELARAAGIRRVFMGINDSNKRMIRHALRHGFTYEGPSPTDQWPFTHTKSNRYEKFLRPATKAWEGIMQIFIVTNPEADRHDADYIVGHTNITAAIADRDTKRGSTINTVNIAG